MQGRQPEVPPEAAGLERQALQEARSLEVLLLAMRIPPTVGASVQEYSSEYVSSAGRCTNVLGIRAIRE